MSRVHTDKTPRGYMSIFRNSVALKYGHRGIIVSEPFNSVNGDVYYSLYKKDGLLPCSDHHHTLSLNALLLGIPTNIRINLIVAQTRVTALYIFAADRPTVLWIYLQSSLRGRY